MTHILDLSWAYLAWQAPFVEQKLVPFRRRHPGASFRRILDIGCGPGTNTKAFLKTNPNYLGVDLNAGYIASAKRRFGDQYFMVGDASRLDLASADRFDCIFVNSMLHHMSDAQVRALLASTAQLLTPDGTVFVIDIYAPAERGLVRSLARADRGEHVRELPQLQDVVESGLDVSFHECYTLHMATIDLWAMAYFEGRPKGLP
ncbi:MAG TPA: class I SAM-dependent methyltransferase [Gemmatimonadales bacterium]